VEEAAVLLPNDTAVVTVVDDVEQIARLQTTKQATRLRTLSTQQIFRNIAIALVLLTGAFAISIFVISNTASEFDGNYDGLKEAQPLDSKHWIISDDYRGDVYIAAFTDKSKTADLHILMSGLSAPNGLAVDSSNRIAYLTDSNTLDLYRINFDEDSTTGYNIDALSMRSLTPNMQYPKKALMHPDGESLVIADQTSDQLFVVTNLDKWPNVDIITLTDNITLDTPHGMTWLSSTDPSTTFRLPPHSETAMPDYMVADNRYVSTKGILVGNTHKVSFVRTDDASLQAAANGHVQTPIHIVDMEETFGLKSPDTMGVQFVPSGDGSFLVMTKNSCGVFYVTVADGNLNWGKDTDRTDGFRITGDNDPGCTVNNPHGITCVSEEKGSAYSNGCVIVQPGKMGGGKLAWLEVPHGEANQGTGAEYNSWNMNKETSPTENILSSKRFAGSVIWHDTQKI
jgi:hypothetical protein